MGLGSLGHCLDAAEAKVTKISLDSSAEEAAICLVDLRGIGFGMYGRKVVFLQSFNFIKREQEH